MSESNPTNHLTHRAFVLAHASHQDGLVQSYRTQLAGFEIAMTLAVLNIGLWLSCALVLQISLLAIVLWSHRKVGNEFRQTIAARQDDVDWSQKELLLTETHLAREFRTFTSFKIYQDRDAATVAFKELVFLNSERRPSAHDITNYFFADKSQSRGKAALMLALPATALRLLAAAVIAHHVLAPALAGLLG